MPGLRRFQGHNTYPRFIGSRNHRLLVEDHGFARLQDQCFYTGFTHGIYCLNADGGHIEPFVLYGLAYLYDDGIAAAEAAAAPNGFIRSINGLHRQDRSAVNYNALPDIQPADLFGQAPSQTDIRPIRS
jgi:hypothetical protein